MCGSLPNERNEQKRNAKKNPNIEVSQIIYFNNLQSECQTVRNRIRRRVTLNVTIAIYLVQ